MVVSRLIWNPNLELIKLSDLIREKQVQEMHFRTTNRIFTHGLCFILATQIDSDILMLTNNLTGKGCMI